MFLIFIINISHHISFFIVFLCDFFLNLLRIFIIIISITFPLTIFLIFLILSNLKDGLMLLIHLFHLLLLVDPSYFFSSALDVLDIRSYLYIISLFSHFHPVYLFG